MIAINRVDEKNITFNGKSCAAIYKAAAGVDEKGEFVVITEIGGGCITKIRVENLRVNSMAQRSANSAANELNQFIGNFKKGGGGDNESMASTAYVDSLSYRKLVVDAPTIESGYLIKLRSGEMGGETVVKLIGYSAFGTPIDTIIQFVAKAVQGSYPDVSLVAGRNFGYEIKNFRLFSMLDDSRTYSLYLWIPTMIFNTHMAASIFDRMGSLGEPQGNLITDITVERYLPADSLRSGEVVFTPKGVERQIWSPKIAADGTEISDAAFTKFFGGFVKDDNRVSVDFYIEGTFPTAPKGNVSILNLPYEANREMLFNGVAAGYSTASCIIGRIAGWIRQLNLYERVLDLNQGYSQLSFGTQLSATRYSIFGEFVYYTNQ